MSRKDRLIQRKHAKRLRRAKERTHKIHMRKLYQAAHPGIGWF